MANARIVNGVAVEVVDDATLAMFTDEIKAMFTTVPEGTVSASKLVNGAWVAPPTPEPPADPAPPAPVMRTKISPVEFKMQFTSAERLPIRAAQAYTGADAQKSQIAAAIDDFFDLIDDPRLTMVDLALPTTVEGVGALATFGLIAQDRVAVILAGIAG